MASARQRHGQPHHHAGDEGHVLDLLVLLGRDAVDEHQVGHVERQQHGRVHQPERALEDDPHEVEERGHQSHDLGRVLLLEVDRGPAVARVAAAVGVGVDDPDHRPAQAGQEPQRPGEVGGHQRDVAIPRDDGFDRELGQHLDPGEQREGESLGDVELRGLRAPGDEEGAQQHGREGPQRLERRLSRVDGGVADHAGLSRVTRPAPPAGAGVGGYCRGPRAASRRTGPRSAG